MKSYENGKETGGMQWRVSNAFKTTSEFYAQNLIFYLSLDYQKTKVKFKIIFIDSIVGAL